MYIRIINMIIKARILMLIIGLGVMMILFLILVEEEEMLFNRSCCSTSYVFCFCVCLMIIKKITIKTFHSYVNSILLTIWHRYIPTYEFINHYFLCTYILMNTIYLFCFVWQTNQIKGIKCLHVRTNVHTSNIYF